MPKHSKVRAALGFVLARSRTVLSLTLPIFSSSSLPFLVRGQVSVKAVRPNVTLVTRLGPGLSDSGDSYLDVRRDKSHFLSCFVVAMIVSRAARFAVRRWRKR